jgi:hypothetical protein
MLLILWIKGILINYWSECKLLLTVWKTVWKIEIQDGY